MDPPHPVLPGSPKKRPALTSSVGARRRSRLLDSAGVKFNTQEDEGHRPGLRERVPDHVSRERSSSPAVQKWDKPLFSAGA
ncbi:hypothetical protein AAY473_009131 [Plecturocebus cupreus]